MAFRSNLREIPDLVRWMSESGNAFEMEVRYTFNTGNITDDFRREHFLRPDDWPVLRASLDALNLPNCILGEPPAGYFDQVEPYQPANWFDGYVPPADSPAPAPVFAKPLELRARSDGRLHLSGAEHTFVVKVTDLDNPIEYFRALCAGAVPTSHEPEPVR